MKKFALFSLLGLVGLFFAVELAAPRFVEAKIEERAAASARDAAQVEADVDSFPLVTRFLLTGRVEQATVTLREVAGQRLEVAVLTFGLEGITFDRAALVERRDVDVRDIDRGLITAELRADDVSAALGVPVRLEQGRVVAVVAGAEVAADVEARDESLVLSPGPLPAVAFPLPLLPCRPDVSVEDGRILLSCEIDEVPSILVRGADQSGSSS